MRWKILLAGACLAALGLLYFTPSRPRIVTYGTSLSASNRWQPGVEEALAACMQPNVKIIDRSKSAMASDWGRANVARVVSHRPKTVLIEFAINDAYEPHRISLEQSYANTAAIVHELRAALPDVEIFLMTTNPTTKERPNLEAYYLQYRHLASDLGVKLIDLYPVWQAKLTAVDAAQRLVPDRLHPTAEAYREVVLPEIVTALSDGRCLSKDRQQ